MVNIYDIVKATALYNNITPPPHSEINAAIVGPKGVILTDDEACHTIHGYEDSLELSFGAIPVKELLKSEQSGDPIELGTWVRTFGARIEANYCKLLASIKEIGLDNSEYPRKVRL